ncbi:hypothetical protein [Sphingomonas faeni]|uniref:hypothetical protein n=1 Tax=Sphingomonas faeni TaxID=185950 RepID=UPI00335491E9
MMQKRSLEMNPIEKQAEIMTELAQLMLDQVEGPYEFITCEYEYVERYSTVSSSLSVIQHGTQKYPDTAAGYAIDNAELCTKLRGLMKCHTGGEWTSFTLSLDAGGKAKTKFYYY